MIDKGNEIKFTGERMIPTENREDLIYLEHMTRYLFAVQCVKDKSVLDIACGSGYGAQYLAEAGASSVYGLDISSEAIEYAEARYKDKKLKFVVGNAEKLPFNDSKFDTVVSFETIEHLKDQLRFVKELRRVVKNDGIVVISTPNKNVHPSGNEFHTEEFTPESFRDLISREFKHVNIYYQHNVLTSYVLTAKNAEKYEGKIAVQGYKLYSVPSDLNMFMIAVASNNKIPEVLEASVLFNNREIELLNKDRESLNRHIVRLENELNKIQKVTKTRGWRIITFIHNLRQKYF